MTQVYYYVNVKNLSKVLQTEVLEDLVIPLWEGLITWPTLDQIDADTLQTMKKALAKYETRVPLYDITYDHIYLIFQENVYERILKDYYRFITLLFVEQLQHVAAPDEATQENLRIMAHYDLRVLQRTYHKIFYRSFKFYNYITDCARPSYTSRMDHIKPYYKLNELYFLIQDWNLSRKTTFTDAELVSYCLIVSRYDMPAKTLIDHQWYIYNSLSIGLIKYFSLFGSYYMNQYLRHNRCALINTDSAHYTSNVVLENQIQLMIRCIHNAPALIKSHTVYRFVQRDDFYRHLQIGDVYTDCSFMSTTRNPFYYKKLYSADEKNPFGLIMIKIKLPGGVKGVGLSIEAYSNFPDEEEIILSPTSQYRLINIEEGEQNMKYHGAFDLQVQKKYEFEWLTNDYLSGQTIQLYMQEAYQPEYPILNMQHLVSDSIMTSIAIPDRLTYFQAEYTNVNHQFQSSINDEIHIFSFQSYDSSNVYRPFFYYTRTNGIMITVSHPSHGNVSLLLEMGVDIHVNYYFKYSISNAEFTIEFNEAWIAWLSMLAFLTGSRNVIIHSRYEMPQLENDYALRYVHSADIYNYLKHGQKAYVHDHIVALFDYAQLDKLRSWGTFDLIQSSDRDELYRLAKLSQASNLADFYIYIVDYHSRLIQVLETKLQDIYEPEQNPFLHIAYRLDAWGYMYAQNQIAYLPSEKIFKHSSDTYRKMVGDKKIPKFKNRLRSFFTTTIVKK